MTDPNELLEQELRGLRPAAPPERLAVVLERALHARASGDDRSARAPLPPAVKFSLWASWSLTALAASFALVVGLRQIGAADAGRTATQPPAATQPAPAATAAVQTEADALRLQPIASGGYLLGARDEGFVLLEDGLPARQVRYQFVDTVRLRAPGDAASVSVSYPREEVRLIPVKAY